MKKVLFDSMVYDRLEEANLRGMYDQAQKLGLIECVTTHITLDQLDRIPDKSKRSSVLSIANVHNTTSTFGHVENISRPGWSSPAPKGTLEPIIGNQLVNEKKTLRTLYLQ